MLGSWTFLFYFGFDFDWILFKKLIWTGWIWTLTYFDMSAPFNFIFGPTARKLLIRLWRLVPGAL